MIRVPAFTNRRTISGAVVFFYISAVLLYGVGAMEGSRHGPEQLLQGLLQACYPELAGRQAYLELTYRQPFDHPWQWKDSGDLGFRLRTGRSEAEDRGEQAEKLGGRKVAETLLSGYLFFGPGGELKQLWIGDTALANGEKNNASRGVIEAHPEWPDAQAISAIKEAGARFGPEEREDFLKSLPLKNLGALLGALRVESAQFMTTREPHLGSFAVLNWRVVLEPAASTPGHPSYVALFEPFDGRLIFLSKNPVVP